MPTAGIWLFLDKKGKYIPLGRTLPRKALHGKVATPCPTQKAVATCCHQLHHPGQQTWSVSLDTMSPTKSECRPEDPKSWMEEE